MQIVYCDDCGTRVDEAEAVAAAGKQYCQQCAGKHVVPKSGGTVSISSQPRSTRSLPRARTGAKAVPQEAAHAAPGGKSARPASNNKALVIGLSVVFAGAIVFVLLKVTGAPKSTQPIKGAVDPTAIATTTTNPVTTSAGSTIPSTTAVLVKAFEPDPREDKARRDWNAIQELIASGKSNPYDIRLRVKAFVEPFWIRKTTMGQEALKLLDTFKIEKRIADTADGAVPGVLASVSKDKGEEAFNTDFQPGSTKTIKEINFQNTQALKAAFGRDEYIAVKFTGFIEVPSDGTYTFFINSDDGSNLYIGDQLLVENGGNHPATEHEGTIDLKKGKHRFRLEYFNGNGLAAMIFSWSGTGIPAKQVVPAPALFSVPKK